MEERKATTGLNGTVQYWFGGSFKRYGACCERAIVAPKVNLVATKEDKSIFNQLKFLQRKV
jgi:hypothetical protein